MNPEKHLVEHERFEDLCMLSTAGELTPREGEELQRHVASCSSCREALSECRQFVNAGMAYLASEFVEPDGEHQLPWAQADAKRELFSRLKARKTVTLALPSPWHGPRIKWIGLVAALILALGLLPAAYRSGERKGGHQASVAVAENHSLSERLQSLTAEKIALDNKLQAQANSLAELAAKLRQQTEDLAKLRDLDKTLQIQTDSLAAENHQQSLTVDSLSGERDSLAQKLQDARQSLHDSQSELASVHEQRQRDLLHSASLETEIRALAARMKDQDTTVAEQENFLASDRDIRELMGARDLYIADVFDVDGNGTKKPYGRVFYTKNKSLIFYAFDLDQQPRMRNAAIFQAWGRHGVADKLPLNMGIFYLDNEANRRWILKFDDPEKLAQIDAVFVTVEPHGGSKRPSGRQLLFASLRSMANHP